MALIKTKLTHLTLTSESWKMTQMCLSIKKSIIMLCHYFNDCWKDFGNSSVSVPDNICKECPLSLDIKHLFKVSFVCQCDWTTGYENTLFLVVYVRVFQGEISV
jgi:hypothetical protein